MATTVPHECASLGFVNVPTTGRNTFLGSFTVCGNLNVDSLNANAIHGITENLATGAVVSGLTSGLNVTILTGPEMGWIRVGNGIVANLHVGYQATNNATSVLSVIITPTGPLADLFIPSGLVSQIPQRWTGQIKNSGGTNQPAILNVLAPGNVVSGANTVIQFATVAIAGGANTYNDATITFGYNTADFF